MWTRDFNPRAPCGARPSALVFDAFGVRISTHAPLAGRDWEDITTKALTSQFQPTRPLRGATHHLPGAQAVHLYFNPRAPCGARPLGVTIYYLLGKISTHAPLAGRDTVVSPRLTPVSYFNPRAPCGARPRRPAAVMSLLIFQPTRPLRGATAPRPRGLTGRRDFNPRAPCGARPPQGSRLSQ